MTSPDSPSSTIPSMTTDPETRSKERQALLEVKSKLTLDKREHDIKLAAITNLIRTSGRMPPDKYRSCCNAQTKHKNAILDIERQLAPIKQRLTEISDEESLSKQVKPTAKPTETQLSLDKLKTIITDLVNLRQEFQEFSADSTRISSKRQMASEFVLRLNPIIKRAINI